MIYLTQVLAVWDTPAFENTFKMNVEQMTVEQLPLQQALSSSSYALDSNIKVIIISMADTESVLKIKTGVYYSGIIAGCNCADDPTPVDEIPEYCVLQFEIDKASAETRITLLDE